jgi:hypothetical protein
MTNTTTIKKNKEKMTLKKGKEIKLMFKDETKKPKA